MWLKCDSILSLTIVTLHRKYESTLAQTKYNNY